MRCWRDFIVVVPLHPTLVTQLLRVRKVMPSSAHTPHSIRHDTVAMDGTGFGAGADVGVAPLGRWMDARGGRAVHRRPPAYTGTLAVPSASRGRSGAKRQAP